IYIYILIMIISIFLIWAYLSEKEILVKTSGIVRPLNKPYNISSLIQGEVKRINIKNGQKVKKGDLIIELDSSELELQKNILSDQLKKAKDENQNLEKFIKCVKSGDNYFEDNKVEGEFFYKFKLYEAENKNPKEERKNLSESKDKLINKKKNLELLRQAIEKGEDFSGEDSVCKDEFNSYKLSKEKIENLISELEKNKKAFNEVEQNKEIQGLDFDSEIKNNREELDSLKRETNTQIQTSIESLENNITEIESNLKKIDELNSLNKEKNNASILAQANEQIKTNKDKIDEIKSGIEQINSNIEKCNIRAKASGKVDLEKIIEPGIVIQPGMIMGNILQMDKKFMVELVIPNKDIANLKEGQEIKYSFEALPYKEYGFLSGKLENIDIDSKSDKDSKTSFFMAEGNLDKNTLFSHKKEEGKIKPGMTCKASIITRKEKMLYYLLEKLDFEIN
ncbi:HlyD family efflux transporter periplasmic adaptor subunit, partial [Paraclostridium sordellii]